MSPQTIEWLTPEIVLILGATAVYLAGCFTVRRARLHWAAAIVILAAAGALAQQPLSPTTSHSGPLVIDAFAQSMRWLGLGVGLVFLLISARSADPRLAPEFAGSLVLIVAGLCLLASAADLVLIFLALELVSIPTYVVLYLGRADRQAQEAATKYFFLSILSSAVLLYGFSFLYGATGSTSLRAIAVALPEPPAPLAPLAPLALVLVFAGLGFRLTAVPFHFYAPDVYQGTSHPNAGLLAVVPKIAGLVALVRLAFGAMSSSELERVGWQLSLVLAVLTMTVGNLLALAQQNVRRLLAYSSIAHAGYMLIGLAVGFAAGGGQTGHGPDGVAATLFYLVVYALATAGIFAALAFVSGGRRVDTLDDLAGLAQRRPTVAAALAVCLFSLAGLPPLAGFWGKFTLLIGAIGLYSPGDAAGTPGPWFLALAIVGAVNAAIAATYYLRMIGTMYFRPASTDNAAELQTAGPAPAVAMGLCTLLVIFAGLASGPLLSRAETITRAARAAFASTTAPVGTASTNAKLAQSPTPNP